ncbi:hypothetical protein CR513_41775, partial [Mucuna pruriens]
MRLVTLAFGDYALIWWTYMLDDIRKGIIEPCENWYDLKHMMRKWFSLYQGSKSVEEFQKEMEMTMLRAYIREKRGVYWHDCGSLGELVHQVVKVEMQLKRRSASKRSTANTSSWKGRDREKEKVRSDKSLKKGCEPFKVQRSCLLHILSLGRVVLSALSALEKGTSASSESKEHSNDSHYDGDLLMVKRLMGN